ncbi:MAG: hypothetical protein V4617_07260 [Gemmatimonadota bacterium]
MSTESNASPKFIRIDLTTDQQDKVMQETGKQADAIELTVKELEERIAPKIICE